MDLENIIAACLLTGAALCRLALWGWPRLTYAIALRKYRR